MNTPTLYLMSKYSGREAESLKEDQDAWLMLHRKGYLVYSPICESHNIEEYRKEFNEAKYAGNAINGYIKEPDYVARDLRFIEKLSDKNGFMDHTFKCNRCDETIMWNWAKGYGGCKCGKRYHHRWTEQLYTKIPCPEYDSGVVGVVLPSAKESVDVLKGLLETEMVQKDGIDWDAIIKCNQRANYSIGVMKEYNFCHSKHILCISLETALTVPPNHWKEMNL